MAWYDRPEGFTPKSFDVLGPTIEVGNGIRFTAIETKYDMGCQKHPTDPMREHFCGACHARILAEYVELLFHSRRP